MNASFDKEIRLKLLKLLENDPGLTQMTPKGFEELTRLTASFLKIRLAEYKKIKSEI